MDIQNFFINSKRFRFKKRPKPVIEIDKNLYLTEVRQLSPSKFMQVPAEIAEIPFGLGKSEKFVNKQLIITAFSELGFISEDYLESPLKSRSVSKASKVISHSPISVEHVFYKKIFSPYTPGVVRMKSKESGDLSGSQNSSPQKRQSFLLSQRQFATPQPSIATKTASNRLYDSSQRSNYSSYTKTSINKLFTLNDSPKKLPQNSSKYENMKELTDIQERVKQEIKSSLQSPDILEYIGSYLQGKKEGSCKITYKNGDKFKGTMRKDSKEGQGSYFYSKHGLKFKGEFKNNLPHGPALLEFASGGTYKVNFVKGKLDDNFVMIKFKDGSEYDGEFKDGRRHGFGKMDYANGGNYSGKWVKDQRCGPGVLTFKGFIFFEGNFFGDFTDGPGVLVRKDVFSHDKEKTKADTRSALFMKHEGSIIKKKFFEDFSEFNQFRTLPVDSTDLVFITLKSKYLENRLNKLIPDGKFMAGKLTGGGMAKYSFLGTYYGNFCEGKRSGYGRMTYTDPDHLCDWFAETEGEYTGEWKDDKRQGFGIMTWPNGAIYTGWFNNNRRHNVQGKIQFTNGDIYEGGWVEDRMEGSCTLYKKGMIIKGSYKAGILTNLATLTYPDGKVYDGEISNYIPHGSGRMKWVNNNVYQGEFVEGTMDGVGRMVYANGDVYDGSWENGSRNGYGVLCFCVSRERYEGEWAEDKRSGEGIIMNSKGEVIKSGYWSNDELMI